MEFPGLKKRGISNMAMLVIVLVLTVLSFFVQKVLEMVVPEIAQNQMAEKISPNSPAKVVSTRELQERIDASKDRLDNIAGSIENQSNK